MQSKVKDPRDGIDMNQFLIAIQQGIEATIKEMHISRRRIKEICELEDIPIPARGRPQRQISQAENQFCSQYKENFHVGYQRMADAAKRHNIVTSEWNIRKIFQEQDLFCFEKSGKADDHPHLFVARYVGQLWHADIHYVTIDGQQQYLLGFIDDRSRFLLYFEILSNKTSEACSQALIRALGHVSFFPKMLTIDNGGEFTGNPFQTVLQVCGIEDYRTHPYTPEENGKIERFWLTIERAKGPQTPWSVQKIKDIINEYNNFWSHRSLKMLTLKATTPYEAWTTMVKYSGQADADIVMLK